MVQHVQRVREAQLGRQLARRIAAARRGGHRVGKAAVAQDAQGVQEQVAALGVPVAPEVQQHRHAGRQPQPRAHLGALGVAAARVGRDVERVGEVPHLVGGGAARPDAIRQMGGHAQDPLHLARHHAQAQAVARPGGHAVAEHRVHVPVDAHVRTAAGHRHGRDVEDGEVGVQDRGARLGVHHLGQPAPVLGPRPGRREQEPLAVRSQVGQPLALARALREHRLGAPAPALGLIERRPEHGHERPGEGAAVVGDLEHSHRRPFPSRPRMRWAQRSATASGECVSRTNWRARSPISARLARSFHSAAAPSTKRSMEPPA